MMKKNQILWWLPRLFTSAVILFIGSFSADSLTEGTSIGTTISNLVMHLLPAIVLAILLAIAWKKERAGGIAFIALGLALTPFVFSLNHGRNQFTTGQSLTVVAIINLPVVVAGILFLVSAARHGQRVGNIHK